MSEEHEVIVLERHDVCGLTHYCKRCGLPASIWALEPILCAASDNLIAISHIRALRIFSEKVGYPDDSYTFPS